MNKLQFDPSQETRLQATLRVIREASTLEELKKKRRFGETLVRELSETMVNVTGKMMRNKSDTEYLQQLDFQIHLIKKVINEKEDQLRE